jgi:hypothetical protein
MEIEEEKKYSLLFKNLTKEDLNEFNDIKEECKNSSYVTAFRKLLDSYKILSLLSHLSERIDDLEERIDSEYEENSEPEFKGFGGKEVK